MPGLPPSVITNAAARAAFMQTNEFKATQQNWHSYQGTINSDDTVTVDEARAGEYRFGAAVFEMPDTNPTPGSIVRSKCLFRGAINVTIPADLPSGNLDAGVIELQAAPDAHP